MNERQRPKSRRARWAVISGLACLPVLATLALGLTASSGASQPASSAAREAKTISNDHDLCQGGAVAEVDIHLTSALAGSGTDRGESLVLEVTSQAREDKEVSYAVEVLSVDGRAQGKTTFAAPRLIRRGGGVTSLPCEAPEGLADGYYRVLVTTLTTGSGGDELADTHELYIRSRDGAASVVSHDEWYERSGIQRHGQRG